MKEAGLHNELKKEFQLERLILFSDAVFAIAITLLVIEIKAPEFHSEEVTEQMITHSLFGLIPKFIGFFLSFFLIGLFWTVHHRLFGYVVNYTQKLLWLNLWFLLTIALMPFSSAFYSEYIFKLFKAPFLIYCFNVSLIGVFNFILWRYITNPKNNLTEGLSKEVAAYFKLRALIIPIIFTLLMILYFITPWLAICIPVFVPVLMFIIAKIYKRKLAKMK